MTIAAAHRASKVPEVTLVFWIIKIAATTLGETGGDTVTMTLDWGYLAGTAIFLSLLVALILIQIAAREFHPPLYWATIIASTTAPFCRSCDRSRLTAQGFGDRRRFAYNTSAEGEQENRRVNIIFNYPK